MPSKEMTRATSVKIRCTTNVRLGEGMRSRKGASRKYILSQSKDEEVLSANWTDPRSRIKVCVKGMEAIIYGK